MYFTGSPGKEKQALAEAEAEGVVRAANADEFNCHDLAFVPV
jgi:hypothetical protein